MVFTAQKIIWIFLKSRVSSQEPMAWKILKKIATLFFLTQVACLFAWTRLEGTFDELKTAIESTNDNEIELVVSDKNPDLKKILDLVGSKKFKIDLSSCSELTEIPARVFYSNTNLESVVFPTSLSKIGNRAFDLSGIKSVDLPKSLTEIGDFAFSRTQISSLTIPKSVSKIGLGAFAFCKNLPEIKLEDGNSEYKCEDGVLFTKNGLTLVQFPAGKAGAMEIPKTVIAISSGAFEGAEKLSAVTLSPVLLRIGGYAFFGCIKLKEIEIPDTVTYIGQDAFGQTSISKIAVPKSVISLGSKPFEGALSLEEISVQDGNVAFNSQDGVLFSADGTLIRYPPAKSGSEYSVPAGTKKIASFAFADCTSLKSVTLPDGTLVFGKYTFRNDSALAKSAIPTSTREIGREAFWGTKVKSSGNMPQWYDSNKTSFAPINPQEIDAK